MRWYHYLALFFAELFPATFWAGRREFSSWGR